MLFGSLSVNGGALFGVSATVLASLPVVSAIFALIGGIIAFNKSKWGALFLLIAGALCVPSKDTWLYGGIYFFTMLLCFFLKKDKYDEYENLLYEENEYEDEENENTSQTPQYYLGNDSENYEEEEEEIDYLQGGYPEIQKPAVNINKIEDIPAPILAPVNDDVRGAIINNEPPKLRRRMSKICPTCGATAARESRYCSVCGTPLSVAADELLENPPAPEVNEIKTASNSEINFADINSNSNSNFNVNDGDDMAQAKVFVKPKRDSQDFHVSSGTRQKINSIDAAASSYQEFSRYTRRAKKRKRSAGRKVLSMLLLVSAVGGALYFLLGLRKLPPGDLPPIARNTVISVEENKINNNSNFSQPVQTSQVVAEQENIAQPVAVNENILPNFTPDREPKMGVIVGSNVNVRADHTTSSNRVTRLNVNSKVDIIGNFNVTSGQHQGIWYNITTGGREGWIYGRYVQPLGSGLPAGYSNALLKSFGNNKSQLIDSLGQPSRNSATSAEWQGLTATFKGEYLTRIRITNSRRELQNGLKVGMSQTALLQIMGYPSGVSNKILQYNEGNKTGLSVQLDKNNAISTITVNSI